MDEVHAWHEQNFTSDVSSCYNSIDSETYFQEVASAITCAAAFSDALPPAVSSALKCL